MAKTRLYCHECGRTYGTAHPVAGLNPLHCAACGAELRAEPPPRRPPRPKDAWIGKAVAGAKLRRLLLVRPDRRVYEARHPGMRVPVRVEVFPLTFGGEHEDYVRRLFAQAALARELHSLHAATVLDLGRRTDCWYIMTELRPSSLRCLLDREGRLDVRRVLSLAEGALQGLEAVHAAGAAHGNVTPEGILLDYDGSAQLDHPAALTRPEELDRPVLTEGGAVTSAAFYAAPELADAARADVRSDLYSLGATVYEALAGQPPGAQDGGAPPAPLHTAGRGLPVELSDFVARLMAEDPAQRPATPQQALEELRELAIRLSRRGEMAPVRAALTPSQRRRTAVRWATGWGLAGLALLVLAVMGVTILWRQRRLARTLEQEAAPEGPGRVVLVIHPAGPVRGDPLPERRKAAVRALLAHELALWSGFELADGFWSRLLEERGGRAEDVLEAADARHLFAAAHSPGYGRRRWALSFVTRGRTSWSVREECAVEGGELAPLERGARTLLERAADGLGLQAPAAGGLMGGDAESWADAGAAIKAERTGDWDAALAAARAARGGSPDVAAFAVLEAFCEAVTAAEESGRFPAPVRLPEGPLPPELASLWAVLDRLGSADGQAIEEAFGAHLARHPRSARGYYLLGRWRLDGQGRPGEALVAFRHAFDVDPYYEPAARACVRLLAQRRPDQLQGFLAEVEERVKDEAKARRLTELAAGLAGTLGAERVD